MTSIELVWGNVKRAALEYAERGVQPTESEARARVAYFVKQARCDPQPPPEAVEFFVSELITLSAEPSEEPLPHGIG
ncbi:MAG TPA: hypothetical protein VFA29_11635 [Candidatus Baltobacteraceae bacterium]|nr:hypothetical protein [Candidatus Baltobacteraceae bacterium]